MTYLIVRHNVKDYATWKPVFDTHHAKIKSAGGTGGQVFRNADNPNEVLVLTEWNDLKKAREFTQAEDLRSTMERAGVISKPEFFFLNGEERFSL
jgi:heme-degrading monooxygenase HmoA